MDELIAQDKVETNSKVIQMYWMNQTVLSRRCLEQKELNYYS